MSNNIGISAYHQHQQLFMLMTARAFKGPWETFGVRVFYSLRETNRVLYDFIGELFAKNFIGYELEVLALGLAIFFDSLPDIPKISEWSCKLTLHDLRNGDGLYVHTPVKDEFYQEGLDIAFKAFTDFIRKVCRTDMFFSKKMLGMGYIISAAIIHENEYGFIGEQVEGRV